MKTALPHSGVLIQLYDLIQASIIPHSDLIHALMLVNTFPHCRMVLKTDLLRISADH